MSVGTHTPTRPRVLVGLIVLASGVAQGFGRFSYALLLPAIDRDLLGSYALAGLIGTANVALYLIGTIAVSAVSSRVAPAALMRWGLVATTVGLFVLWRAPGPAALAVGLSLTGLGGAFIWVPAPGLAGSVVPPERRGMAIGVAGSGIGMGIIFASTLGGVLQSRGGDASWRTVYLVLAVIALAVTVACVVLLRPPPHPTDAAPVRTSALRRVPGWLGLVAGYTTYGLAYSIYTTYVVTALENDAGYSTSHAATDYILMGLALVTGGVLLGPLSDRWGRGRTLMLGYAMMGTAILLVLTGVEPLTAVSALVFGTAMSGLPAVIAAHLSDWLTPREFAGAFGRCTLAFGVTQLAGPPLGGWLAETTGSFTLPFLIAGAVALSGSAASLLVVRARPALAG